MPPSNQARPRAVGWLTEHAAVNAVVAFETCARDPHLACVLQTADAVPYITGHYRSRDGALNSTMTPRDVPTHLLHGVAAEKCANI